MIKMELDSALVNCPSCWIGFIESLEQETKVDKDAGGYTVNTINKYLKPYEAMYVDVNTVYPNRGCHILFNHEEDAIIFKLKFGI